jgi:hypothetical protein
VLVHSRGFAVLHHHAHLVATCAWKDPPPARGSRTQCQHRKHGHNIQGNHRFHDFLL